MRRFITLLIVGLCLSACKTIDSGGHLQKQSEGLNSSADTYELTPAILEKAAFRFALDSVHHFPEDVALKWQNWIGGAKYVGLAEVHNSKQLSFFTAALLPILEKNGFDRFALELGPNSAAVLNEIKTQSNDFARGIKNINQKYGKNSVTKTPLIFANKEKDALFLQRAADLGFEFWGLDQEFAFAYEMLFDRIYEEVGVKDDAFIQLYHASKAALQRSQFKRRKSGQPVYCWYQNNEILSAYLDYASEQHPELQKVVEDIRESWDIYCRSASGLGSNQQRANYMKKQLEKYEAKLTTNPGVFLKFGGVHLTHHLSSFGVNDLGKYLHEKTALNNEEFISIRHIITYRNGRSNINRKSWKNVSLFLKLGRKDQWTAIDLRPFRAQLEEGELKTSPKYAYQLMNYDILLISPNDQYDKPIY